MDHSCQCQIYFQKMQVGTQAFTLFTLIKIIQMCNRKCSLIHLQVVPTYCTHIYCFLFIYYDCLLLFIVSMFHAVFIAIYKYASSSVLITYRNFSVFPPHFKNMGEQLVFYKSQYLDLVERKKYSVLHWLMQVVSMRLMEARFTPRSLCEVEDEAGLPHIHMYEWILDTQVEQRKMFVLCSNIIYRY